MKLVLILADNGTENTYIMMEARLDALFKKPEEYTVIERFAVIIRHNYSRTSCSISCIMLQQKNDNLLLGGFWYLLLKTRKLY